MDWTAMVMSIAKLAVFSIFITAIIQVIKNIAAKGLFTMIKELVIGLWKNSPLSADSMKMLNFVIALFYCKVFQYGVMQEVLQLEFGDFPLAYFLDYIGTAAVIYMGADWFYDQVMVIKAKYGTTVTTKKEETTETKKETTVVQ